MKVRDTIIEVIKGDGEDLHVDAVAVESVEDLPEDHGNTVNVFGGTEHSFTIVSSMVFDRTLNDVERVREGYVDVLHKARDLSVSSLALIPFGYEKGVISPAASAKVLAQELLKFIRFASHHLEKIYVCIADIDHFDTFERNIIGYMTHIQDTLGMGPYVTVDAIIETSDGLVIVDRSNPPYGWALPGGFVDYGESLESAVVREVKEETGLEFTDFRQFKTCSDPKRDPRFHTVSTVFIGFGVGVPQAGDDAAHLRVVPYDGVMKYDFAFDHKQIIGEYLRGRLGDKRKAGNSS